MTEQLSYDRTWYAPVPGGYVHKSKYGPEPTRYSAIVGDHPHDPDGDFSIIAHDLPTEQAAILACKSYRIQAVQRELRELLS